MLQSWVSKAPWAQPISRHATKLQQFIVERIPHSHISSSVSSGFGLRMRTGSFKGMQNFPALLVLGRLAKLQFRSTVIELSCCHLFGRISHAWCEIVRQAAPKAAAPEPKSDPAVFPRNMMWSVKTQTLASPIRRQSRKASWHLPNSELCQVLTRTRDAVH